MSLLTQFYNCESGGGGLSDLAGYSDTVPPQAIFVGKPGVPPTLTLSSAVWSGTPSTSSYPDFLLVRSNTINGNATINMSAGGSGTWTTTASALYFKIGGFTANSGQFLQLATGTTNLQSIDGAFLLASGYIRFIRPNLPDTFTTMSNCVFNPVADSSGGDIQVIGNNFANLETCTFYWGGVSNPPTASMEFGEKLTVASVTKIIDDAYNQRTNGGTTPRGVINLARGTNAGLSSLSAATQAKIPSLTGAGWTVTLNA